MPNKSERPYNALNKIFHEPSRLAILSALIAVHDGMTFNELKRECELTDGNLSRHLRTLEEAEIIRIQKSFEGSKPRTRVFLTQKGRESFIEYLQALEEVLKKAAAAMVNSKTVSAKDIPLPILKLLEA
ncbi:MAG: helix-turn-helix domain-containing protein [Calditrichaeota bacterium]|nr:helix-turn-helix domain-containing protein [Calditrichota bacterium]